MVRSRRGDAIVALNRLVGEAIITSFKTNFFDHKAGKQPKVTVYAAGDLSELELAQVAERVRATLDPVTGEVAVTVQRELKG